MEVFKDFGIQPVLLFGQIVNFLIIFFLLRKFFFGKITKILDDRRTKIAESLKNADLIEEKLQKTNEETQKLKEDAQKETQVLLAEAKERAEKISETATTDAKKVVEEAKKEAIAQVEIERQKMQKELQEETLQLVVDVVKKVLGRNLQDKEKQQLTKEAIGEIGKRI